MSYRSNADEMSVQEQINDLRGKVNDNNMNGEQQYTVRMWRNAILGILGFLMLSGGMAFGCNHEDNKTKLEISKQCPAVSPILAVGLTKHDGK